MNNQATSQTSDKYKTVEAEPLGKLVHTISITGLFTEYAVLACIVAFAATWFIPGLIGPTFLSLVQSILALSLTLFVGITVVLFCIESRLKNIINAAQD